ncbi:hypothetical protein CONLIGDRAFT_683410 [Coniochaeta ligniaria NRRL 30616]|uniref:Uncharacterized protein n=1 Tax=Coniochaeta ligniaria NRRL 30616 TaxID=1408157 RepID=A0A1J7JB30_9PEZI|nr:hypothetical protein CONLIGDRAFT_683410 [Coniochaeta ligniaria NRRL 30616]
MQVSTGIDGKPQLFFNEFEGAVGNARFSTGATVDGNADTQKLLPGAADHYDAVSKMGQPTEAFSRAVLAARAANPKFKLQYRPKLWQLGKDCSAYVFALRRKNMDDVGHDHSPMSIPAIDFDKTIATYKGAVPNIQDLLDDQNTKLMALEKEIKGNMEKVNLNHLKATEAGRAAITGCNCERKTPPELRKRARKVRTVEVDGRVRIWDVDPIAVNWGCPRVARSRKMRARRLAAMGVAVMV